MHAFANKVHGNARPCGGNKLANPSDLCVESPGICQPASLGVSPGVRLARKASAYDPVGDA